MAAVQPIGVGSCKILGLVSNRKKLTGTIGSSVHAAPDAPAKRG